MLTHDGEPLLSHNSGFSWRSAKDPETDKVYYISPEDISQWNHPNPWQIIEHEVDGVTSYECAYYDDPNERQNPLANAFCNQLTTMIKIVFVNFSWV